MEPVRRRRCETCAFHEPGPTACTGLCRNLEWQPRGGVRLFVRDREIACYQGWGRDSWSPKPGADGPGGGHAGQGPGGGYAARSAPTVEAVGASSIPFELLVADVVIEAPTLPARPATSD